MYRIIKAVTELGTIFLTLACALGCDGGLVAKVGDIQGPDTVEEYGRAEYGIPASGSGVTYEWFVNPPEAGQIGDIPPTDSGVTLVPVVPDEPIEPPPPAWRTLFIAGDVTTDTQVEICVVVVSDQYEPVIKSKDVTITPRGLSVWNHSWGGGGLDWPKDIVADDYGNVYTMGFFGMPTDFDPGPGTDIHTSNGNRDVFLSKINTDGEFQWAVTWGGSLNDEGHGVAVDGFGNVYVTGWFTLTVDFDPGPGVDEFETNGLDDVFLSKFNSDGEFQWARVWGGSHTDNAYAVKVGGDGSVYVTGFFTGIVDFDPGTGEDYHDSHGGADVFLSSFNPDGDFQWARIWGGGMGDHGYALSVDGAGNSYVTGGFSDDVDFDPGLGIDIHVSHGGWDVFLSKFSSSGDFLWAQTWGGDESDFGEDVSVDGYGGAYVTGSFYYTFDFDPGTGIDEHASNGNRDVFLARFDSTGNYIWANTWGGTGYDYGNGVGINNDGDVYVLGTFENAVDFDPGPNQVKVITDSYGDTFLVEFNPNGRFNSVKTIGNEFFTRGTGVAVDGYDNIFCTGYFAGTIDLNPGSGVDEYTSNGNSDVFLCKFPPDDFWWLLR